ncbi:MAG: Uma2 family endonuclease, partial [Fimbriiglobus sp.]
MSAIADVPAPTAPAAARLTPDDLLLMGSEGKGFELVDGQLKEVPVSFLSSYVAGRAFRYLDRHVEAGGLGWVVPEGTSFRCFPDDPGRVRRADTAFFALDRVTVAQATTEGHFPIAPDLVVEVVSPHDLAYDLNRKVEDWLRAGTRLVWVIDPDARLVFGHRPDGVDIRREADSLTGEPVLPGFTVPVA